MKYFTALFLIFLRFNSFAQNSSPLEQIISPSPIAKEIDKYLTHNVSLYNGIPEISIPFYEINIKGLIIPIGISYHASGIKYKQNSGEVGLGWTLLPNFRISKTIHGRDDEGSSMPSPILDPATSFGLEKQRSAYLVNFINFETTQGFPSAAHSYDGEYDIFSFSVQNGGGVFIEKNRTTHEYEFLDSRKNKLTRVNSGSGYYFELIDGNGIKYKMGRNDGSAMETHDLGGYTGTSPVGWMTTEITTPYNDTIKFEYVSRIVLDETNHLLNATIQDGLKVNADRCFPTNVSDFQSPYSQYQSSFLSKIITKEEVIEFFRNPTEYSIQKVEIRDKNNSLIRKVELTYSQNSGYTFLNNVSIFPRNNTMPQVYGLNYYGVNGNLADMTYDNWGYHYYLNTGSIDNSYVLPEVQNDQFDNRTPSNCINSPSIVYTSQLLSNFLFNKKVISNTPTDFSLKKITYPTGGYSNYEYESHKYKNANYDLGGGLRIKRISSYDGSKGTSLIKEYKYGINEDGKGFPKINLEKFDFVKEGIWSVRNTEGSPGEITGRSIDKQFNYSTLPSNEAVSDAGSLVYYPEVWEYVKDSLGNILGKTQYRFDVSELWYSAYDQFQSNSSYQPTDLKLIGSIPRIYFPRFIKNQAPWVKPILTESYVYGYSDGLYKLHRKEEIQYNEIRRDTFAGLKVRQFLLSADAGYSARDAIGTSPYHDLVESLFDFASYNIISGSILPKKKIVTDFSNSNTLSIINDIYYNENDQVIREVISDSKSGTIINEIKYPFDYKNVTSSDVLSLGVKKLQDRNIHGQVIEKINSRKIGTNNPIVISAQLTYFKSTLPLPDKIVRIETASPLQSFTPSIVQNGVIVADQNYKPWVLFSQYDNYGNLLEQQVVDNIKQAYIWGYNSKYPIAEVINSSPNNIYHTSFEDIDGNSAVGDAKAGRRSRTGGYVKALIGLSNGQYKLSYWQKSSGVWSLQQSTITVSAGTYTISLTGQIDEVRFHPITAQMTTYTYSPLIGMTSVSDINNNYSFYEYDGFNRLYLVRDKDGNILKKFCYNYSGQIVACDIFINDDKSGPYTRNNCGVGYTGSSVAVSIPEGMFTSTVSVADANAQAIAYGQTQANLLGTCVSSAVTLKSTNTVTTGSGAFTILLTNESTSQVYNFSSSYGTNITLGTVPAGMYTIYINRSTGGHNYLYNVGCEFYGGGMNYTFYNVPVNLGCNTIMITNY